MCRPSSGSDQVWPRQPRAWPSPHVQPWSACVCTSARLGLPPPKPTSGLRNLCRGAGSELLGLHGADMRLARGCGVRGSPLFRRQGRQLACLGGDPCDVPKSVAASTATLRCATPFINSRSPAPTTSVQSMPSRSEAAGGSLGLNGASTSPPNGPPASAPRAPPAVRCLRPEDFPIGCGEC